MTISFDCQLCFSILCIWALPLPSLTTASQIVSVQIPGLGTCQGRKETVLGKSVDVFRGIPYAKPPVGTLRFKAPEPITWSGVRNSTAFGAICPQLLVFAAVPKIDGEEDCLTLDIYKPSTVSGKLAVMFWIHGGGYITGSGHDMYDGNVLAVDYNVIVVTINYRLGLLGFFNIPGTETKGNYGMLDQIAALRWVKKNIESFGGDANKVTTFGESAGASSVSLLTISPLTRNENLFKRAILQSGAASCPFSAFNTKTTEGARKVGALLGCSDLGSMTECIRGKPLNKIIAAQIALSDLAQLSAPSVDNHFLKSLPWDLEQRSRIEAAPVEQMIGFNKDEGTMFGSMYKGKMFALMPNQLNKTTLEETIKFLTERRYLGKQDMFHKTALYEYTKYSATNAPMKWLDSTTDFYQDYFFVNCVSNFSDALTRSGKTVYRYKFSYMPAHPLNPLWKVAHAIELGFVFGAALTGQRALLTANYTNEDKMVSRKMMQMWTDFAKNGQPGNNWPKYTLEKREYMDIASNLTVARDVGSKRMAFWNDLVPHLTKVSAVCDTTVKSSSEQLHFEQKLTLCLVISCVYFLFFK